MGANLPCFASWHTNELTLNKFPASALAFLRTRALQYLTPKAGLVSAPDFLASETPPLSPMAASLVRDTVPHADKAQRASRCDSQLIKRSQMDRLTLGRWGRVWRGRQKAPSAPSNPLTMHTNSGFYPS